MTPGDSLQAAVDAHPAGTTFVLAAGVHREQRVTPKSGNRFFGQRGPACRRDAKLKGSRLLEGWERSGSEWFVDGQTQRGVLSGDACKPRFSRCRNPDHVFLDGRPLQHVASRAAVGPGRFFFDYQAERIYIGDDPSGRVAEAAVTAYAFGSPTAARVHIEGLDVSQYATPVAHAAVGYWLGAIGPGWVIQDNDVHHNGGLGAAVGDRGILRDNLLNDNAHMGATIDGDDALVEGNEIARNNWSGVAPAWEAGGLKWADQDGAVLRGNCVHHNHGPGLWADIDVGSSARPTLYEDNVVFLNDESGIFHEISHDAVIRGNRVGRNGAVFDGWLYGAQILVAASENVLVEGNSVEVDSRYGNAITVIQQDREHWVTRRNVIRGNDVTYLGPEGATGVGHDFAAGASVYDQTLWTRNRYHASSRFGDHFHWSSGEEDFSDWQARGNDQDGSLDTQVTPGSWNCDFLELSEREPATAAPVRPAAPVLE